MILKSALSSMLAVSLACVALTGCAAETNDAAEVEATADAYSVYAVSKAEIPSHLVGVKRITLSYSGATVERQDGGAPTSISFSGYVDGHHALTRVNGGSPFVLMVWLGTVNATSPGRVPRTALWSQPIVRLEESPSGSDDQLQKAVAWSFAMRQALGSESLAFGRDQKTFVFDM